MEASEKNKHLHNAANSIKTTNRDEHKRMKMKYWLRQDKKSGNCVNYANTCGSLKLGEWVGRGFFLHFNFYLNFVVAQWLRVQYRALFVPFCWRRSNKPVQRDRHKKRTTHTTKKIITVRFIFVSILSSLTIFRTLLRQIKSQPNIRWHSFVVAFGECNVATKMLHKPCQWQSETKNDWRKRKKNATERIMRKHQS